MLEIILENLSKVYVFVYIYANLYLFTLHLCKLVVTMGKDHETGREGDGKIYTSARDMYTPRIRLGD